MGGSFYDEFRYLKAKMGSQTVMTPVTRRQNFSMENLIYIYYDKDSYFISPDKFST